jgi:hypothetical protein
LAEHQTGKRRVVFALRQRHGRTLAFVTKHEADGVCFANTMVDETAQLPPRDEWRTGEPCPWSGHRAPGQRRRAA